MKFYLVELYNRTAVNRNKIRTQEKSKVKFGVFDYHVFIGNSFVINHQIGNRGKTVKMQFSSRFVYVLNVNPNGIEARF